MDETARFTIGILVALFVSLLIAVPVGIYKARKYIQEGRSIENLPIKIGTAITLPILSIPILLSNLFWPWKIGSIIVAALGAASYLIGIDAAQKALRKLLGLPPIDESTGMVVEEKDDNEKDKKEN